MPLTDIPPPALLQYRSSVEAPHDLEEFWRATLAEARDLARPALAPLVETGLTLVETRDVTFSGYGGHPVHAWYHRPVTEHRSALPVIVRYQGYGSGRGLSHQVSPFVLAGFALLDVDTRGQGGGWSPGDTGDPVGSGPSHPGFLTRGLLHRDTYYYRRVFTDAVRAVEEVRGFDGIDPERVIVTGVSQGGGISLAVAGLVDHLAAVMPDVPFLCDFPRAVAICGSPPYSELAGYLSVHPGHAERAFNTLAYFDATVLGRLATAPALFSVGHMDQTCPPSTVYAAFNAYGGTKEIRSYPYNDHEGGHAFHEADQLHWLIERFRSR